MELNKMETVKLDDKVKEIVRNVRWKIRTKKEVKQCSCKACKEALKILERD